MSRDWSYVGELARLRKAAQQALEVLDVLIWTTKTKNTAFGERADALRAALAEPDEAAAAANEMAWAQVCAAAIRAEREACARVCEQYAEHQLQWRNERPAEFRAMGANEAAEAIRARGNDDAA